MNDYAHFKKYSKLVNDQAEKACTLRGFLRLNKTVLLSPMEEVEPAEKIWTNGLLPERCRSVQFP